MKKIYILPLLIFTTSICFAQNYHIKMIVEDSTSKQILQGASVKFDFITVGVTDKRGLFQTTVRHGSHSFSVSFLGYRAYSQKIDIKQDTVIHIPLIEIANELGEVMTSGKGYQNNLKETNLGVQQLSIKQIQKLPSALGEIDILRALQTLPGVTSVGEGSNGVNIRGGTVDQNLMLLDGAPIFNPTHLFGLFSAIPPEGISSINLYKGAIPAEFGGRVASVIDVKMKEPNLEKFSMTGGLGLISSRLAIESPIIKDKLAIMVASRGCFNDFMLQATDNLKRTRANFAELAAKVYWKVSKHDVLSYSTYLTSDFIKLIGVNLNTESSTATDTDIYYKILNQSLKWSHIFSPKLNLQFIGISSKYQPNLATPEINKTISVESEILYRKIGTSLNFTPNDKQQFDIGFDMTAYQVKPGVRKDSGIVVVNLPIEKSLELAGYFDDKITFSSKFSANIGIRYSYFQNIGAATIRNYQAGVPISEKNIINQIQIPEGSVYQSKGGFEPRIGLRYFLNSNSSLKLGYNLMRQYIQIITNNTTPLPVSRWKTSDTHLNPQVSQLISLGYFKNFKNDIYELSAEAYYRYSDNIIEVRPGSDFLLKDFVETDVLQGLNRSFGLELLISKKKGATTGWLSYTFSRSLNKVDGNSTVEAINQGKWYPSIYDRPHNLNANISIATYKTHTFSLTFNYATGRPYTIPNGLVSLNNQVYPVYVDRNNARIPDYHRLDFSWMIKNPTLKQRRWEGSWTFTLYNVYGHNNVYSVFFRNTTGATQPYQLSVFSSIIPSLTYNFNFM